MGGPVCMFFFMPHKNRFIFAIGIIIILLAIYFVPKQYNNFIEGTGKLNGDIHRIAVLCYHHLAPMEEGLQDNNNAVLPVDQFRKQMSYLHNQGYYTATMEELRGFLKGEFELPKKTVVITFDDGYESNHTYAFPILKEYGLKATIFLAGKSILDYEDGSQGVIPKLSKNQIKEMLESGMIFFENHSFDMHKYIDNKPAARVKNINEIEEDFKNYQGFVEQLGIPDPIAIAYPFGYSNKKVVNAAEKSGYRLGLTIKNGYIKKGDKPMSLPRFIVYPYYSLNTFTDIIEGKGILENAKIKSPKRRSEYDLIVVGSDPEGVSAAVSGSRLGLKTLLIDKREKVGGLMTLGGLATIDMNYNPDGKMVTKGIFEEFFNRVGKRTSIDVEETIDVFEGMLNEFGVNVALERQDIEPVMEENNIVGVKCDFKGRQEKYLGKMIIDATQDADIAAFAGVPYTVGMEDMGIKNKHMAVTPVFKLEGVDWTKVAQYLNGDNDRNTGADQYSAWGYNVMYRYTPQNPELRIRGLNMARQENGSVLVNALQIFNVDPLDPESREKAIKSAEKELPYIIDFMRENCPGLENAEFAGVAKELYIRESRHIYGEYRLTVDDVLENQFFEDTIAFGSYPVDVQATSPSDYGMVVGNPAKYGIPLRCLVPLKVGNLLVVGKSASYDSLAAGSARTIPVGMCTGEAAGVTAWYALVNNLSLRDIINDSVHAVSIREVLNKMGAALYEFSYDNLLKDHWCYPQLKKLRSKGFIYGKYDNNYFLGEEMPNKTLCDILNRIFMRLDDKRALIECKWEGNASIKDITEMLNIFMETDCDFKTLYKNDFISESTYKTLKETDTITGAHIYTLLSDVYDYYASKKF